MRVFTFSGLNSLLRSQDRVKYLQLQSVQDCFATAEATLRRRYGMQISFEKMAQADKSVIYSLENINLTTTLIFSLQVGVARNFIEQGFKPDWVTGISLGDIARTVIAGAVEFEDAVEIANVNDEEKRGIDQLGESVALFCSPSTYFSPETVAEIEAIGLGASQLSARFLNVSGSHQQVAELRKLASMRGWKVIHLLHYPFHSLALGSYSEKMANFLDRLPLKEPKIPIFSTTFVRPLSGAEDIRNEQKLTFTHAHHWMRSAQTLIEQYQVDEFINIGPCQTLSKTLHELQAEGRALKLRITEGLHEVLGPVSGRIPAISAG